jgi:hypothetical protein
MLDSLNNLEFLSVLDLSSVRIGFTMQMYVFNYTEL